MSKIEITQLFYPEDKNLEHFYEVLDKLEKERLKETTIKVVEE